MKLTWQKRRIIREIIKSIVVYIFLIVTPTSIVFNYLWFTGKLNSFGFLAEQEVVEVEKTVEVIKEIHWYRFHATGYSANDESQGTTDTMASGKKVYKGAIAADPNVLPLGTRVEIKGLPDGNDGIYKVEDTGGLIKDNDVDIYYENKSDAEKINCDVWLRILEEDEIEIYEEQNSEVKGEIQ